MEVNVRRDPQAIPLLISTNDNIMIASVVFGTLRYIMPWGSNMSHSNVLIFHVLTCIGHIDTRLELGICIIFSGRLLSRWAEKKTKNFSTPSLLRSTSRRRWRLWSRRQQERGSSWLKPTWPEWKLCSTAADARLWKATWVPCRPALHG